MKNKAAQTNEIVRREKLRDKLKHGDISNIADICDVNRLTVHRWFQNKSNNNNIEEVVTKLIERRNHKVDQKINQIL